MRIECAEDCGNAPRKAQLKELIISLAKSPIDAGQDLMADDIVWDIVGKQRILGPEAVLAAFAVSADGKPAALRIHNIITHGNIAAANYSITMDDGIQIEYCDVYVFRGFGKNGKLKEVRSYRIYLT